MPNRQSDGTRINEDIRISPIRLVKEDGEAVIMETKQANFCIIGLARGGSSMVEP